MRKIDWWAVTAAIVFLLYITFVRAFGAEAASLKVCFKGVDPSATSIELFIDSTSTPTVGDILAGGASQADGSTCTVLNPLPAAVKQGTTQTYALKAADALGRESVASNAITFRYPAVPTAPTIVSVGASLP